MASHLPPVSPQLPFVLRLDNKDSAEADLDQFHQDHIALVIIGNPDKHDLILKLVNAFCSEPTADDRLRALWIEEGEILEAITPSIETRLKEAFPQEPCEQIRAYTAIAGSNIPLEFLRKGRETFNGITIKMAINRAVINSPAPNTESNQV